MRPLRILGFLFLISMPGLVVAEQIATVRVGVVAEDPDVEAVLTSNLGKLDGFEMFTRSELPSLQKEVEIFTSKGEMHVQGLDRLILITKVGGDFAVRVADCSTGAVMHEASLPSGLNPAALSEFLALRLPRHLQRAPKAKAQRIALLGVRFAVNSVENRSLEARLNLACAVALQGAGEALVLERWRMKDLVFENSLRAEAITPFWNATAIVEGLISREENRLIVKIVVRAPSGEEELSGRVEGNVEDLAGLGRALAAAILKMPTLPAATSEAESKAFLAEADWLLNHSLYTEAVQAVECAVALDPGNQDAEIRRIRAYSKAACGDDLSVRNNSAEFGHAGAIKKDNIGRSVAMASEMSRLVEDHLAKYPGWDEDKIQDRLENPGGLGVRALLTSLHTLTAAYDYDYYLIDPEGVEMLRASTEWTGRVLRKKTRTILRSIVDRYLTNYAGYWCSSPEAAIKEYRSALSRDFESGFPNSWTEALRISLVKGNGKNPPLLDVQPENRPAARPEGVVCRLVAWRPGDETKIRNLWEAFLEELAASNDLLNQADALYFRWGSQVKESNREMALGAILDFLKRNPESMGSEDGRAMAQMLTAPLNHLSYVRDGNLCIRYVEVLIKLFEQDSMVPYEMVQGLPQAFGYRRNDDILPGRLAQLAEVMEHHLAKREGGKDNYYTGMLAYAISGLRGISAKGVKSDKSVAVSGAASALKVTRLWPQHRYLKNRGDFHGNSGAVLEGDLWFSQNRPLGFWKINPESFKTEFFDSPEPPKDVSHVNSNSRPFFRDGRIFVSAGDDVWSYELASKHWKKIGLPACEYFLFEANGALWAVFGKGPFSKSAKSEDQGTGLYRLDTKKLTGTLAFSTRRRPPESPLDLTDIGRPLCVFSGSDGQPVVGLVGQDWKILTLTTGQPWPLSGPTIYQQGVFLPEGALVMQRERQTRGRNSPLFESLVSVDPQGKSELLLWHPDSPDERAIAAFGQPVWTMPRNLTISPATGSRYFHPLFDGKRLILFVADIEGSSENFTSSVELVVFERGRRDAIRIPLQFDIPADAGHDLKAGRRDMTHSAKHPRPLWNNFLGNSKGYFYTGQWGFWFIPMADFEHALAEAVKQSADG